MRRLLLLLALPHSATAQHRPLDDARQLIVVTTPDWDSVSGRLQRYARDDAHAAWRMVGTPLPIVVGRNGLGWGRGVHPMPPGAGPVKHEGDGRAPAGIFTLAGAFGYAPPDSARWVRLPYRRATPSFECVDDSLSRYYNQTLERSTVAPDWSSSEIMRRDDVLYRWGVIVAHNMPAVPGAGSCIFLHIWSGPADGTAGCTAMAEPDLLALLDWLDPHRRPLLVQLTGDGYRRLRDAWRLP